MTPHTSTPPNTTTTITTNHPPAAPPCGLKPHPICREESDTSFSCGKTDPKNSPNSSAVAFTTQTASRTQSCGEPELNGIGASLSPRANRP